MRNRSETDKRDMYVVVTEEGMKLRERAVNIPAKIGMCVPLEADEAETLYRILHKMMGKL